MVLLQYGKQKTNGVKLNNMLAEAGYLQIEDGVKLPTGSGTEIGITAVERNSERGRYFQCMFGPEAQRVCMSLFAKEL